MFVTIFLKSCPVVCFSARLHCWRRSLVKPSVKFSLEHLDKQMKYWEITEVACDQILYQYTCHVQSGIGLQSTPKIQYQQKVWRWEYCGAGERLMKKFIKTFIIRIWRWNKGRFFTKTMTTNTQAKKLCGFRRKKVNLLDWSCVWATNLQAHKKYIY